MISSELQNFYERWLWKAEEYQSDNLQDCFDRFFTLFVAYNRLYAELALSLVKKGRVRLKGNYISDAQAAKSIMQAYVGTNRILRSLESDATCTESLASIITLIERRVFAIKLDRFSRLRSVEADSILLEGLKSDRAYQKVYAVLDVIYSIRCNMFHGQKGYNDVQIQILVPVTMLLKKIMNLLYEKMSQDIRL